MFKRVTIVLLDVDLSHVHLHPHALGLLVGMPLLVGGHAPARWWACPARWWACPYSLVGMALLIGGHVPAFHFSHMFINKQYGYVNLIV